MEGSSSRGASGLWAVHQQMVSSAAHLSARTESTNGIPLELRQYLSDEVSSLNSNPFEELETVRKLYPHVVKVAFELLPILATSVPSERLFSKAGQLVTKERNRLSPKHIDQMLFLRSISETTWFETGVDS